jgi:hypothetical protein
MTAQQPVGNAPMMGQWQSYHTAGYQTVLGEQSGITVCYLGLIATPECRVTLPKSPNI